jgi:hypothetical protein
MLRHFQTSPPRAHRVPRQLERARGGRRRRAHVLILADNPRSNLINTSEYHNVAQTRGSADHPANHHLSMLPEQSEAQSLMPLPLPYHSSAAVVLGVPVDKSGHGLISETAVAMATVLSTVAVKGDAEVVMQLPSLVAPV